jgi:hypothetical protein
MRESETGTFTEAELASGKVKIVKFMDCYHKLIIKTLEDITEQLFNRDVSLDIANHNANYLLEYLGELIEKRDKIIGFAKWYGFDESLYAEYLIYE